MKAPNISVVMATYNGGKYLDEQLKSIFSQTLKPAEIIVCDDNSKDNTVEILNKYADQNLLSVYVNQRNLGVIENFKQGASLAKEGNCIAFADQDDIWVPDKLLKLLNCMNAATNVNLPAMVYSDLSVVNDKGEVIDGSFWKKFSIDPQRQTIKTLLITNIAPGCTMLINSIMRKEFITMPAEAYMHDAWITFVAYAFKNYAVVKEPLVYYRQHSSNVTFTAEHMQKEKNIFEKFGEYFTGMLFNKPLLEKELLMAGAFLKRYGTVMGENDIASFEAFLSLSKQNFIFKKLHLHKINRAER